jgi:hypothetical protein
VLAVIGLAGHEFDVVRQRMRFAFQDDPAVGLACYDQFQRISGAKYASVAQGIARRRAAVLIQNLVADDEGNILSFIGHGSRSTTLTLPFEGCHDNDRRVAWFELDGHAQ